MCGLAGLVHPNAAGRRGELAQMLARIGHRGRDGREMWAGSGCLLGHNRLAIIDLTDAGAQPMASESGRTVVAVNGEIYNHAELRADVAQTGVAFHGRSDVEPVPYLYERYGLGFAERLQGMFAVALWDAERRRLVLARDRLGKKPLYYAPIANGVAFASEMKALFALSGVDLTVRDQGIADYLAFGAVPGAETIYHGIHRVPPGHIVTFEPLGEIDCRPYWSLDPEPTLALTADAALDEIDRLMAASVERRLESDVPLGCFLSGGIDSGLVAAYAARALDRKLNTYAVGVDDPTLDERRLAARSADALGTNHSAFVVDTDTDGVEDTMAHFDEPFSDASAVPAFAVARRAAEDVSVVLNGDGGDELFCGYRHFIAAKQASRILRTLGPAATRLANSALSRLPPPGHGRSRYQFLHRLLRVIAAAPLERPLVLTNDLLVGEQLTALYRDAETFEDPLRHVEALDIGDQPVTTAMTLFDVHRLLGDQHLVKMDMASMAATLEARSPLLDHQIAEFAVRLPDDIRLPGWRTKPLLRRLARRHLPAEIARAPKKGFEIPLERWMRNELAVRFRDRLDAPGSFAAEHFDRAALDRFRSGEGWDSKRWAHVAWSLYCLEIWWERQADRGVVPLPAEDEPPARMAVG